MSKTFETVSSLLNSLEITENQKEEQLRYINEHNLSRMLTTLRCRENLSQTELAKRMKCGQSRIAKLEHKEDRKITIGDLIDFSESLDLDLSISFMPKRMKFVDRIKMHAFEIQDLLKKLVCLSKDDEQITKAVNSFHDECLINMLNLICDSKKNLEQSEHKLNIITPLEIEEMIAEENLQLTSV